MPTAEKNRTRKDRLRELRGFEPEIVVVGGGITGAGIALDLTLRGVRTLIVERGDWGGATSSASSRLVHGGLRYLEQFEFGLVRESCLERALLLKNAAGLVWPETFLFPVRSGDRVGRFKLAAGLALYSLLSIPRVLGVPGLLSARRAARRIPGIETGTLRGAGHYLDGATDDSRLTLAVALSAGHAGALAIPRMQLQNVRDDADGVSVQLRDELSGEEYELRARAAVLAGGPFTEELRQRAELDGNWISATRGSHIVVPRERLPTDGAVIFASHIDGRVMFLIPWPRYTIVGTTDLDADPTQPIQASRKEVDYLLESVNGLLPLADLEHGDVVSTWAGLRPLLAAPENDPSARSREERIAHEGHIFTIAGGKLTAFRGMAEKLGARVCRDIGVGDARRRSPTRNHSLHGAFAATVPRPAWSQLNGKGEPQEVSERRRRAIAWSRRYAALAEDVRRVCGAVEDGERVLDAETLLGEVDWSIEYEDCLTLVDFFFRRTDLGLGPRKVALAALDPVSERMGSLLDWDADERRRQKSDFLDSLASVHAWREQAP